MSRVDIGFLENTSSDLLQSHHLPSKIGGKPSWLALKNLPDLKCDICTNPLIFLCQVYAPYEEDLNNFHRTLFVFVCRNADCCKKNENGNLKVFRNQLKRDNEFYSSEPPDEKSVFNINEFVKLCFVCGGFAEKHCSKCKDTHYCTREHQVLDWKAGHKKYCIDRKEIHTNNILFPEYELVIEEENLEAKKIDESQEMQKYEKMAEEGKLGTLNEISESDLDSHANFDSDKTFLNFRKKISENPDQVLRYDKGGQPLWIAEEPKPQNIPPCENCGSERQFEFQILPQLLFQLKEENIDWGVLVVYSCKKSCTEHDIYKKEYIFKQDVTG